VPKPQNAEQYFEILKVFSKRQGLIFNPDAELVRTLIEGLWTNKQRYGYPNCPCRLSCEDFEHDKDIFCPCVYAPPDIEEYGQCYCGLYVHQKVLDGTRETKQPPERRPTEKMCF